MALEITYKGLVNLGDIIGRVLGPDEFKGYYAATWAEYDAERDLTKVHLRSVHYDEDVQHDAFGQLWLSESAADE